MQICKRRKIMCSHAVKHRIHNLNRYAIAALSIAGFSADGLQATDLFFLSATALWIWLPECDRWEAYAYDWVSIVKAKLARNVVTKQFA
jgi:hypothetical protein